MLQRIKYVLKHENILMLRHSKNKALQVDCISLNCFIHVLYVVTYAKYCHSDCVVLTFKRIPEDDPNRDRNILEQSIVRTH
jgi:hypothetical protein